MSDPNLFDRLKRRVFCAPTAFRVFATCIAFAAFSQFTLAASGVTRCNPGADRRTNPINMGEYICQNLDGNACDCSTYTGASVTKSETGSSGWDWNKYPDGTRTFSADGKSYIQDSSGNLLMKGTNYGAPTPVTGAEKDRILGLSARSDGNTASAAPSSTGANGVSETSTATNTSLQPTEVNSRTENLGAVAPSGDSNPFQGNPDPFRAKETLAGLPGSNPERSGLSSSNTTDPGKLTITVEAGTSAERLEALSRIHGSGGTGPATAAGRTGVGSGPGVNSSGGGGDNETPSAPKGPETVYRNGGTEVIRNPDGSISSSDTAKRERTDRSTGKDGADPCSTSAGIDREKYGCGFTKDTVEYSRMGNMLSQAGGAMATQVSGMSAQVAAQQAGTQSAALRGAAETQATSARIQIGTGMMNAAAGALQLYQAFQHRKNEKEIGGATTGAVATQEANNTNYTGDGKTEGQQGYIKINDKNDVAQNIYKNWKIDDSNMALQDASKLRPGSPEYEELVRLRTLRAKENLKRTNEEIRTIGRDAVGEQASVKKEATMGGIFSAMTGVQQLVSGSFNLAGANQLKKAADKLEGAERMAAGVAPPKFDGAFAPLNNDQASRGVNGVLGSTQVQAAAEAPPADDPNAGGAPPRDDGFNPLNNKDLTASAPTPGVREPNKGGDGAGGGGGGFSPGGGTQAAPPGHDNEAQARMTDLKGGSTYEIGGNGGGGRGGGAGGRGGSDGPDLSSLLAAFMPKKEESGSQGNGRFDYGGGTRGLASQASNSLLGPGVNIFDRISKTYMDKTKRGIIGF